MIAIAVDDEALMLGALAAAVEASPDITSVAGFSDCEEALEYVKTNPLDIAFLDINMRGMGGLALAEKIVAASACIVINAVFILNVSGIVEKAVKSSVTAANYNVGISVISKKIRIALNFGHINAFGCVDLFAKGLRLGLSFAVA